MPSIRNMARSTGPNAARPLLEGLRPASPTGKLLNLHAQMAHSPVVLRDGGQLGDDKTDSLVSVIREAAGRGGRADDTTCRQAVSCGWDSGQLTEAFAYLALTVFTAYFLNYAQTPVDLPPSAGEPE